MVIVIIIMVISIIFFLVSVKIQYILYRSLYSSSLPLDPILASPPDIIRLTEHNHSDQITTTTTTTHNHSDQITKPEILSPRLKSITDQLNTQAQY